MPLRLRGLLLLNLKPSDGLDQIENAPPLGAARRRHQGAAGLVPGISFDADGKAKLGRPTIA